MSVTKELIEEESQRVAAGTLNEINLHREGTFLRAYNWSAWLACRYLHDFKVNKRAFKGIDEPVAYIGFPETSVGKWTPEGAEQVVENEKHLLLRLPEVMLPETSAEMNAAYRDWLEGLPLTESRSDSHKSPSVSRMSDGEEKPSLTLTSIMQRILAFPIESRSPLDSMTFLADVKRQLAMLL